MARNQPSRPTVTPWPSAPWMESSLSAGWVDLSAFQAGASKGRSARPVVTRTTRTTSADRKGRKRSGSNFTVAKTVNRQAAEHRDIDQGVERDAHGHHRLDTPALPDAVGEVEQLKIWEHVAEHHDRQAHQQAVDLAVGVARQV